jgi:GNAT superfamily N-acetyltransferase
MASLTTFQDSRVAAPLSHQLLSSLAAHGPQQLLGVRQWPAHEQGGQAVTLHIECVAAGTPNGSKAANKTRGQVMRLLTKDFSRKYIPGPVLAGRNLRGNTDATMPLNLDHRAALQIALMDAAGEKVVGAALMYLHGPAFGYLPFFAVSQAQRGNGLGSRFAQALCSVLRCLRVDTLVVEACVDPATRDDKVVGFWKRAGLEPCTDEHFDNRERHTNSQRSQRLSGSAIRSMSGVFAFPDACIMFRGTGVGWRLEESPGVALPAGFQEQCDVGADAACRPEAIESVAGAQACGTGHVAAGGDLSAGVSAASALQETRRSGELSVSVCDVVRRSTPGNLRTDLSSSGASGEESRQQQVPKSTSATPGVAAEPPYVLDNVRFFTGCPCEPARCCAVFAHPLTQMFCRLPGPSPTRRERPRTA